MYFVLQEESTMEEYLNKSKISGDIFRFLYLNKQSSRQEISQSLGISLPTITRSLNTLQKSGFIENAGEFQSTGISYLFQQIEEGES